MRHVARNVFLGLLASVFVSAGAQAQVSLYAGGGASIPVGDFGKSTTNCDNCSNAKLGWMAMAGLSIALPAKGVSIWGEGLYGSNKHDDTSGDKTNLFGGMAGLMVRVGDPAKPGVYFFGGVGGLNHQYKPGSSTVATDNEWKFAWDAGAGVDVPIGGASIFVEGRFLARTSSTQVVPIMAGVSFPIGSK